MGVDIIIFSRKASIGMFSGCDKLSLQVLFVYSHPYFTRQFLLQGEPTHEEEEIKHHLDCSMTGLEYTELVPTLQC